MKQLLSPNVWLPVILAAGCCFDSTARAASVGTGGYTNDFSAQPPAADWSTYSISGAVGDITSAAAMDAAVQNVAATTITAQTVSASDNPAAMNASATWSSSGFLQTRPTGNGATLLMCTLVNNLGADAAGAIVSYNFSKAAQAAEEIPGQRAYFSLSGTANSWINLATLSSANPGRLTTNLTFNWPSGSKLYLLWADDNDSPSPDTACQIDNFSVTAISAVQVPVQITNEPQSQIVAELQPTTFSVGWIANPPPTFQWYTNGAPIPDATNASYVIPVTPLPYHGLEFQVIAQNIASNVSYSVTSQVAVLTVNADTNAPVLLGAQASGLNQILAAFSEWLAPESVANLENYAVAGPSGSLIISNAVLDTYLTNIIITVSTMTPGVTYTLTVNGLTDQSAAANVIASNSQAQFTAASFNSADIGNPPTPGSATLVSGGYDVTSAGTNIAGASDQFFFNYQSLAGNFDLKVRVAALSLSDVWAKAGLMARETLTANSRFAMAVATPSASGAYFLARSTTGGNATPSGGFPVNYPNTWLRLARVGGTFTGYASLDGQTWIKLNSVTLSSPNAVFHVGMAVTGATTNNQTATAQFRDQGSAVGDTVVPSIELPSEPLGPATRNTGLIISEIMYHPKHSNDLEFIELFNTGLIDEDLSGCRLSGDITYWFPSNTVLKVGAFLVVARNPAAVQQTYGITGVLGPWVGAETNALSDSEGQIRFRTLGNAVALEVNYGTTGRWPLAADGAGHSLVLARPSIGQDDVRAWAASEQIGGSPGRMDPINTDPIRHVVINEFLANTDPPQDDFVELYNHSAQSVDISGAYLSDDRDTNKFRIPAGTVIPAGGHVAFNLSTYLTGFALSADGERIYLVNSNQSRVIDVVDFEAQAMGVSSGRYPDGTLDISQLATPTPGTGNSAPRSQPIVINEIMFHPITGLDDDEYVELYNRSTNAVDVSDWRLVDGISFTIPANTIIPADGYLIVAKNAAHLRSNYVQLNVSNSVGDYGGVLANGGERIALAKPEFSYATNLQGVVTTNVSYVVVNEVTYIDTGRWTQWADGGGSSLELIDANSDNRLVANWTDSDESTKSSWTNHVFTDVLNFTYPRSGDGQLLNEVQVMSLGKSEALIDDVEIRPSGGANVVLNSTFEGGLTSWLIQGNHVRTRLEPAGLYSPSQCLRLISTAGGDNGANRVECDLSTTLTANSTATASAKMRWLRGYRNILIRLHGGGLETVCTLPVPANLGTPGQRNSAALTNAGPAIYEVSHSPVLPAANEPALVTARVNDPDGIASVQLLYRLDPNTSLTTLAMVDNGTAGDLVAGDGIYSVLMPGRPANTLVAFHVKATDSLAPSASTLFPSDAPTRECLVRFGDPPSFGNLGVYRLWMKAANINTWTSREKLSNEAMDGTFVYNNYRVIYNAGARYRGSPFTRNPSSPTASGSVNYVWTLPDDDQFLSSDELNLDSLEPTGRDSTALREQTSFRMLEQVGLQFCYQRYIHVYINGITSQSRGVPVYSDTQQPNGEFVAEWFADDPDGEIYKVDDWFEFNDTPAMQANRSASLQNYMSGSQKKQARYRWCWEKKFNKTLDDDYSSLYVLVDALNAPDASYIAATETAMDADQWITMLAFRHVLGDWDGYGYNRGKNQFMYRPSQGKWHMLMWDLDFSLGCTGGHGPTQDLFTHAYGADTDENHMPEIHRLYENPHFRRIYMQALQRFANGPLQRSWYAPTLEARYRAFLANEITTTVSPYVNSGAQSISIPEWIDRRRTNINTTIATPAAAAFAVSGTNFLTLSNNNLVTVSGTAPLAVKYITVNGRIYPATWSGTTASPVNWSIRLAVDAGTNVLAIVGVDRDGRPVANASATLTVNYAGSSDAPEDVVRFTELMYHPEAAGGEFVELYNRSTNFSFDLSGWRINGLDFTFPDGTLLTNRGYLVVCSNRTAFANLYPGAAAPVAEFPGSLDNGGETLTLLRPVVSLDTNGLPVTNFATVNRLRYDNDLPWPVEADGQGPGLQLRDVEEDNRRVSNWSDGSGWQFTSFTSTLGNLPASAIQLYLQYQGAAYLDDLWLCYGSVPGAGTNLLLNGDFETPLLTSQGGPWRFTGAAATNSFITTDLSHSGAACLQLTSGLNNLGGTLGSINQPVSLPLRATNITISFWYLPATNYNTVITYLNSKYRPTNSVAQPPPTPGSLNVMTTDLPAYEPLWLNEVQADNRTGPVDGQGQHEPWIELYNSGTNTVDLTAYYLADNYTTNLLQWAFPAGATLDPGQYQLVWLDAAPDETVGTTELHANFRLPAGSGSIALVRIVNGVPQVTDYLNYRNQGVDLSYGDYPDGQPVDRQTFYDVTAGGPNSATPFSLYLNEWMAANTGFRPNPIGGGFDDWFEIHNPSDVPVDLAGYYLTDNLSDRTQYQVPAGYLVPAHGFLLVWADGRPSRNDTNHADLHVNFQLSRNGESLGLYTSDRVTVDTVTFGYQTNDVSQGRYADGAQYIAYMTTPTPGQPNILATLNHNPQLDPLADRWLTLGQTLNLTVTATDPDLPPQTLSYSLLDGPPGMTLDQATGQLAWTPTPAQAPGVYLVTVQAQDNSLPPGSAQTGFQVTVGLPPVLIVGASGNQLTLSFPTQPGQRYRVEYKDVLDDTLPWITLPEADNLLGSGEPLTLTDTVVPNAQRFYRVSVITDDLSMRNSAKQIIMLKAQQIQATQEGKTLTPLPPQELTD